MTFEEAEGKFRELQGRVQRGEPISRAEYEDQVSRLAVQDQFGVLWEINPRTGKWMYFDGAEWVSGAPPGKETSTVIPLSSLPGAPTMTPASAKTSSTVSPSPMPRQTAPVATRSAPMAPPPAPPRTAAPAAQPEGPRPYTRAVKQTRPAAPPPPPGAGKAAPRTAGNLLRPGLEWVPLAIAAVALLICAVLLWVGGSWALATFGTKTSTPTRVPTQVPTTVVPTVVRLPSPTPIPPTPVPVVVKPSGTTANVRAKADAKATKIGEMKKDQQFTVIGRANDGQFDWYQINLTGAAQPGWVRSDVVTVVSGDPKTIPLPGAATATPPKGTGAQTTPTVIGVFPPTRKP